MRGTSCRQDRSGRPAAAIDDSDSDSDEDPAAKFDKRRQAYLLGVPCPGTVVNGSCNNRLESVTANANEHHAKSHHTRSIPAGADKKAAHCADSDDDRTPGEMLDRRQEQVGDTAGRGVTASLMTTNKPVIPLADRKKALYGEV